MENVRDEESLSKRLGEFVGNHILGITFFAGVLAGSCFVRKSYKKITKQVVDDLCDFATRKVRL